MNTDTQIGYGGFGWVYEVEHNGKRYAVKRHIKKDANEIEREHAMLSALQDLDFIPKVHKIDNAASEIWMTLIDGADLSVYFSDQHVSHETKLKMAIEICMALLELHDRSICHGDLKPSNIMRDKNGHIWLIDLGIAYSRLMGYPPQARVGSPETIAPEIIDIDTIEEAGYKSDVYSFGVTLHWLMCQRYLVRGPGLYARVRQILNDQLEIYEGIPKPARDIIKDCTRFKPADRPSLNEVLVELQAALDADRSST